MERPPPYLGGANPSSHSNVDLNGPVEINAPDHQEPYQGILVFLFWQC